MSRRVEGSAGERESGFTLIELLIVVAIIGLLAGMAIPGFLNAIDKARQTSTSALLKSFGVALEIYGADNESYPMVSDVPTLIPFLSPYADTLRPYDNWRNQLHYQTDGSHYTVECYGKDGIDGTDVTPKTRYVFSLDIVYSDGAFINGVE